jgi:hypothetical protein
LLEKNTFLWYPAFLKFAFETQQGYSFWMPGINSDKGVRAEAYYGIEILNE